MTTKRPAAILVALAAINGVTVGALAAPGELDSTFGEDGFARIDAPNDHGRATAIVAQSDGKLLVGRDTVFDTEDLSVLRLNPDGSLDSTFGAAGRASVSVPGASGRMLAIVPLSGGDIVAAGAIPENDTIVGVYDLGLVRYLADGRVDSGFGANSVARARFAALTIDVAAVVEQPGGKLVASVGGVFVFAEYGWKADFAAKGASADVGSSMLLVRLDVAGAVDRGFGTDGFVSIDPSGSYESEVRWLTQQADGKLVAVGFVGPDMAVIRLTADGLLDPTFDGDGLVILPSLEPGVDAHADAVAVQGDGKIVVAGTVGPCKSDDAICDDAGEAAVARLNADGSLDATFGFGGRATFSVRGWERIEIARGGLAIEPDGTLVIGGRAGPGPAEPSDPRYGFVARLTSSGELDVGFGDDGLTLLDVGEGSESPAAATSGIARLGNGAIAVAMSAYRDHYPQTIVVARLSPSAGNPGVLGLAQVEVRAREGTDAQFVVRRTGGTTGAVGIDYWTTCPGWSACLDTADYSDYTPTRGTLTWADGDGSDRTLTIPILADNVVEGDETFEFYLGHVTGGASIATWSGWVKITTDVNDNPGSLGFVGGGTVREDSTDGALLQVSRTGGRTGAVSVDYVMTSVTASAGLDFAASTGTLYWADGDDSIKGKWIPIVNDGVAEGDETFRILLRAPSGGATLGHATMATITIVDPSSTTGPPSTVSPPPAGADGGGGSSGPLDVLLLGLLLVASLAAAPRPGKSAERSLHRQRKTIWSDGIAILGSLGIGTVTSAIAAPGELEETP
jgi:uncharacterized delta-60 repeat protein